MTNTLTPTLTNTNLQNKIEDAQAQIKLCSSNILSGMQIAGLTNPDFIACKECSDREVCSVLGCAIELD